jgi:hypothetical protein
VGGGATMTMTIEPSDFPNGRSRNDHFDRGHSTILSSKGQNLQTFQQFQQQKIWNCRDCHDQIWIDHFDHENFVILRMIMVKFGLTIAL